MKAKIVALLCGSVIAPAGLAGDLDAGARYHEQKAYAKAARAYERAAAQGSSEARRRLGLMYYHGEGVRPDNRRAVELFASAAAAGDVESASDLGRMYEFGLGVEQDDQRAATWYRRAAELGDPAAQFRVSVMYYQGQGVVRDRIEAAQWWTIAMTKGGRFAEGIRVSVESAEGKLTQDELAEGRRRAHEWLQSRAAIR